MSASYFKSKVPEPFRVLGQTMRPLSLGHYGLLKRFECAFVAEDQAKATAADLILGVLICSMRPEEFVGFANSTGFAREVRRWSRHISPRPWLARVPGLGRWWRKRHGFDLFAKLHLFKAYVSAGSVVPKYWDESSDARMTGSHWSQSLEIALRCEVGWTREEVNEEPLSKALADYFKYAESQGLVRLMTDYEIALIEEAEKAEKESKAQSPKPKVGGPAEPRTSNFEHRTSNGEATPFVNCDGEAGRRDNLTVDNPS